MGGNQINYEDDCGRNQTGNQTFFQDIVSNGISIYMFPDLKYDYVEISGNTGNTGHFSKYIVYVKSNSD